MLPATPRAALILAGILVASASPHSVGAQDRSAINGLNDAARAQERQAKPLRRMEMIQRDQARADRNARHNDAVLSRSMRRFGR